MQNDVKNLDLDSEIFIKMRDNFNAILTNVISQMDKKHSREGEIKLGIKISLDELYEDEDEKNYTPVIKHKITSTIQTKSELSGDTTGHIIFIDKDGNICYRAYQDDQISIDDEAKAEPIKELGECQAKMLGSGEENEDVSLSPAVDEDGVIDVEFKDLADDDYTYKDC